MKLGNGGVAIPAPGAGLSRGRDLDTEFTTHLHPTGPVVCTGYDQRTVNRQIPKANVGGGQLSAHTCPPRRAGIGQNG